MYSPAHFEDAMRSIGVVGWLWIHGQRAGKIEDRAGNDDRCGGAVIPSASCGEVLVERDCGCSFSGFIRINRWESLYLKNVCFEAELSAE